ncbi:hypothetical protein LSH36_99g04057 [Paralvinella palmiformis]|uniref:Uncharacterized protein n=1 Tax=Paralvinella palmiformis TaxID=53620 RepID=A0AAD9NBF2_9ANNE|nr:hypothetical protein LSH36_99g04057 [Paralvinella palmiformis]
MVHKTAKQYTRPQNATQDNQTVHKPTKRYTRQPNGTQDNQTVTVHKTTKRYTRQPNATQDSQTVHKRTKRYTRQSNATQDSQTVHKTTKRYTRQSNDRRDINYTSNKHQQLKQLEQNSGDKTVGHSLMVYLAGGDGKRSHLGSSTRTRARYPEPIYSTELIDKPVLSWHNTELNPGNAYQESFGIVDDTVLTIQC